MTTLSLYQASIPGFIRALENLSAILHKGDRFATARKIEPQVLLQSRLAPDMFPLVRQVQIATDAVKGAAARLGGVDVPSYPDTEASFAELYARIETTIGFLKSVDEAAFCSDLMQKVSLKIGPQERSFNAYGYLFGFVLPHFFFHVTTVYDILRHNGVELGKADYLGDIYDSQAA